VEPMGTEPRSIDDRRSRGGEQRIAGRARKTTTRMESSKDSDFLIDGASYRADRAPMNRRYPVLPVLACRLPGSRGRRALPDSLDR
jgi:hypothetical protein